MLKRSTMICICIALILIANLPFEKVVITYKYIIYILIPKGNSKFFCSPRHRQLTWCDHQTTCFLSGQKITQRTWCPTTITQLMRKHQSKSRWFSLPRDFLGGPQLVNAGYLCFFPCAHIFSNWNRLKLKATLVHPGSYDNHSLTPLSNKPPWPWNEQLL